MFNTYSDLKDGKDINNYNNIVLNNYALGSECKDQKIFFSHEDLSIGTASFLNSDSFKYSEMVHINMIDNIFHKLKTPDFLKIDVEGFQKQVIKGEGDFFSKQFTFDYDRN